MGWGRGSSSVSLSHRREPDHVEQPVAVGRQVQVAGVGGAHATACRRRAGRRPPPRSARGVLRRAVCTSIAPPGLGVDEREQPDRRQLVLRADRRRGRRRRRDAPPTRAQLARPSRRGRGDRRPRRRARAGAREPPHLAQRGRERRLADAGAWRACGDGAGARAPRRARLAAAAPWSPAPSNDHRADPVAGAGGEEPERGRGRERRGRASRSGRCRSRGWPSRRRRATSRARGRRSCCARAGRSERAVRFQSMRRTSSPGS